MPELPEVETVKRGLALVLEGHVLARVEQRRPDLRWPIPPDFVQRLTGARVARLARRAKYMLMELEHGWTAIWHLGMSGRMIIEPTRPAALEAHDHIVLTTDAGVVVRFNDARRFGMVDLATTATLDQHPLIRDLGPEPLSNSFSGPSLAASLAGKATPIKAALLDQKVVAGLGNIYVSEALNRSRISPVRKAANVGGARSERLAGAIRDVLEEAIAAGGSTLRDHVQPSGELGYFQHAFRAYDREGEACLNRGCRGTIRRIVQSGRSTFYCAACQR